MSALKPASADGRSPLAEGLWRNTPGLASLIGLCPLLGASTTFTAGVALGLASLAVLCTSNGLLALLGSGIPQRLRSSAALLLIAALVTAVDLLFQARWFDLHGQVGLFVPLIVTNCFILGQAESAAHRGIGPALVGGLAHGAGFTLLLGALGGLRQALAPGLVIATLPPGAFFLLAAFVAVRQFWLARWRGP